MGIDFIRDRRELRARRFASQIMKLMQDYIPEDCRLRAYDYLLETAGKSNLEIINVPPECDEFDKIELERRMIEAAMTRVVVPGNE